MKKTKIYFGMLLLAAATIAFTACKNTNGPTPPGPKPNPTPIPTPTPTPAGEKTLPYSETFLTEFGSFTQQNVAGDSVWEISTKFKCAVITGFKNEKANEDWLVSPAIKVSGTKARMSFQEANNWFIDISNVGVYVSENYTDDVTKATWTKLNITIPKASAFNFAERKADMSAYIGKSIRVAFKYTSVLQADGATWDAGTWEIKNFLIEEGEYVPDAVIGDDEKGGVNNPYSATEVIALNPQSATASVKAGVFVQGVIIGFYDGNSTPKVQTDLPTTNTQAQYNLIIASTADQTDYVCIQLPSGAIRTALNLKDHPGNKGKTLKIKGDILKYNTLPGVKAPTEFSIN